MPLQINGNVKESSFYFNATRLKSETMLNETSSENTKNNAHFSPNLYYGLNLCRNVYPCNERRHDIS